MDGEGIGYGRTCQLTPPHAHTSSGVGHPSARDPGMCSCPLSPSPPKVLMETKMGGIVPQNPEAEKWLAAPPLQKERLLRFETLASQPHGIQVWQSVSDQFGTYPGWIIIPKEQKETSPEVAGPFSMAFPGSLHRGKHTPSLLPVPPSRNRGGKCLHSHPVACRAVVMSGQRGLGPTWRLDSGHT